MTCCGSTCIVSNAVANDRRGMGGKGGGGILFTGLLIKWSFGMQEYQHFHFSRSNYSTGGKNSGTVVKNEHRFLY